MRREAGGRGLAYTRTRVRSHMHVYVRTAGGNYEWSVRDMAEASVGQATAGETSCASSCEENKCTSVNEVLYQTIANIKLIKCNTG